MRHADSAREERLASLLRDSARSSLRPGFADRVMARLEAERLGAGRAAAAPDLFWLAAWRLFPAVAAATLLLTFGLAWWNVASQPDGTWWDRVLTLPAETLDNGLVAQMEDWS